MNLPRIAVSDESGVEFWQGTLTAYLRENRCDVEWLPDALRSQPRVLIGGGAAPAFTVALI